MKKTKDRLITALIPEPVLTEVKKELKNLDINFSQLIRSLLRDFLKKRSQK